MNIRHFFGDAKWVGAKERTIKTFSVLRGHFNADSGDKATLNVLGLGFFKCYINGTLINPDTFLPLSSEYESGSDPVGEILSANRIYVPNFDITPYIKEGENTIAIHFGGGWYTFEARPFGLPKAIYCVTVGDKQFVSSENCKIRDGFVNDYAFDRTENHDYTNWCNCCDADFDDSDWENAVLAENPDTDYCTTDCPRDAVMETLPLEKVGNGERGIVYDCGKNLAGYPVLKIDAPKGEKVEVYFSEAITPDGKLDEVHAHNQVFSIISDGERVVQPEFNWFGFRYIEVVGKAEPLCVKMVCANVPTSSTFDSDNETLNWIYKTFLHTMHCNMHTGHPSDCPHLERRGYTGDGQLTCHAVLSTMDARAFYEKWLQDIADSQDTLSGHIQYTAPYIQSGGGPGGWGCAIVEVPYQLYKHYGDKEILSKYYDNMKRYIDYLEAHSEFGLVTSDKEGEWCLGDWCGPVILYPDRDILFCAQQILVPAPMVNTYFCVKALLKMSEIAQIIGKDEDVAGFREKIDYRKNVIRAAYFNTFDGNFVLNAQGANAFAVDIGIGDNRTYDNMVDYYKKIGHYDTGIFGTDILTRVLFEKGDCDLAVDLLTNNGEQGFEHWRQNGATTFHEYWNSNHSRSHNHPMFGAVVAYLFQYLLGIGQEKGSAGYKSLVINPQAVNRFGRMSGSMTTPQGVVSVAYEKAQGKVNFKITIPQNTKAVLKYDDKEYTLACGENEIVAKTYK